ncbi:type II toxin-antitoxin system VapC family toxin [Streptomyces sp. NRRL F-4474]|uniref:type II toxin-antitoxin system VapC family toxin n=1 Tax=Streptomyces sp. NRRL F-4474 TaxID=1463851 RepID=UPI002D21B2B8|nr:PIN domain-containing protein [Streptomyces sp. NRRL F-4474]
MPLSRGRSTAFAWTTATGSWPSENRRPEALAYLALHRKLKSAGTGIDPPDALIAATALANGWTLVSRNVKHLARTGVLLLNPWEYEG